MVFESSILIIDDDPLTLNLFTDIFLKEGFYKAMGALSGKDAGRIIKEKRPDIILLDVDIAGEEYLEILKGIKLANPYLPVIMLADEKDTKEAEKALQFGACSYVIKSSPVSEIVEDVKEQLSKYLASRPKKKTAILIVDDDRDIVDMIRNFLKGEGYNCFIADDGKRALGAVRSHRPDLIFLDIVMPDIDGIELLQRIKELDKGVKIVMMSGVADKEVCVEAIEKGASGYITKPFSLQQLRVTVVTTLL